MRLSATRSSSTPHGSRDASQPPSSSRVGPIPSRWRAPMDEAERTRATALAFLDEIARLAETGAPPERIASLVASARARLGGG